MKALIATLALVFSAQAFAGANNATLACKSADGKVTLNGNVPGDLADFDVTADITGKNGGLKMDLYSRVNQTTGALEENGRLTVFEDLANGVYTLNVEDKGGQGMQLIRLYALPKTVKYKTGVGGNYKSAFTGKLQVTGENGGTDSNVNCTLDYSI